jgi:hypothetical protein
MKRKRDRPAPEPLVQEVATPSKPAWQEFLDYEERPSREDLAARHDGFVDSMLEPVPMPRWLRGRRRAPREKLS